MGLSQLVSEVHADHPRVILVPFGKLLAALEKFILWEFTTPPKAIAIVVGAAPHRCACMVIQDDHEADIGEGLDGDVEDL